MYRQVIFGFLLSMISATRSGNPVNVGTALYKKRDLIKIWSEHEAIKLQGRMIVDQLLPRKIPDGITFIKYVKTIMDKVAIIDSEVTENYTRVMVADVIGGYMHSVLLDKLKTSYYEGYVGFNVISWLYGMMRKIKFVLNTDGRGWKTVAPRDDGEQGDEEEETMPSTGGADHGDPGPDEDGAGEDSTHDSCAALHVGPADGGHVVAVTVPTPAFDDDRRPGTLALPFSSGRWLFPVDGVPGLAERGRVTSPPRPPPLVRYYRLAVRCVSAAPDRFLGDLRGWLDASVAPLLENRRRWYPVLAGASYVARAAAKASGRRQTYTRAAVGRPRRFNATGSDAAASNAAGTDAAASNAATSNATGTDAAASNDAADAADDEWVACDDGGRLPNVNVLLLVVLLSLTFVWVFLGALPGHRAVRFAFGPLSACLRHTVQ